MKKPTPNNRQSQNPTRSDTDVVQRKRHDVVSRWCKLWESRLTRITVLVLFLTANIEMIWRHLPEPIRGRFSRLLMLGANDPGIDRTKASLFQSNPAPPQLIVVVYANGGEERLAIAGALNGDHFVDVRGNKLGFRQMPDVNIGHPIVPVLPKATERDPQMALRDSVSNKVDSAGVNKSPSPSP